MQESPTPWSSSLGPFPTASRGVESRGYGSHVASLGFWVLQLLPRKAEAGRPGAGGALHVCAELEKEEEGSHSQSTHKDVME